jgi:hypothetical protein
MTCGSPTWGQDKLEANLQKLYGGFYSTRCNDTPPEYRVVLRSEVRGGLQLFFIVYRNRSGQ